MLRQEQDLLLEKVMVHLVSFLGLKQVMMLETIDLLVGRI